MYKYYPIMVDINNELCKVVGGGKIAERKIESLLGYGALIDVISPKCTEKIYQYAEQKRINLINRRYRYGDLKGSFMVYAATDDNEVNVLCQRECEENGILLNVVDNPTLCKFIVPAIVKRGHLTISISTNGKSPMLAKKIREDLEKRYTDVYKDYLNILGEIRDKIKTEITDIETRKKIFNSLVYNHSIQKLLTNKSSFLRDELYKEFDKLLEEKNLK